MSRATLLCVLILAGCQSAPKVPETVTVVVTEYRDLPQWATDPIEKPRRSGDSVGAHLEQEDALDGFVDLLQCHRRLVAKLGAGEAVNPRECER